MGHIHPPIPLNSSPWKRLKCLLGYHDWRPWASFSTSDHNGVPFLDAHIECARAHCLAKMHTERLSLKDDHFVRTMLVQAYWLGMMETDSSAVKPSWKQVGGKMYS